MAVYSWRYWFNSLSGDVMISSIEAGIKSSKLRVMCYLLEITVLGLCIIGLYYLYRLVSGG